MDDRTDITVVSLAQPEPLAPDRVLSFTPFDQVRAAADRIASAQVLADYQQSLAQHTRTAQQWDLRIFATYLVAAGVLEQDGASAQAERLASEIASWHGVGYGIVSGFVRWQLAQGYAIASVNRRLATIKQFVHLAQQAQVIPIEDAQRITYIRGLRHKQGVHLDSQRPVARRSSKKAQPLEIPLELARRLKHEHPDTPQGRRDAALMCLLLDHGLRVSEVADLRVRDVSLDGGPFAAFMTFYRRKVDLTQRHRLTEDTYFALHSYLTTDRAHLEPVTQGPLLCGSRRDGALTSVGMRPNTITDRVRVIGARLQVRPAGPGGQDTPPLRPLAGLSPHDCRHYWATMAIRSGADLKAVQDAGGWTSAAMPLRYAQAQAIANEGIRLPR
ncbi:MAG: tyrosine-type recombinase/integrase [Ktedonobacterales bacterium]